MLSHKMSYKSCGYRFQFLSFLRTMKMNTQALIIVALFALCHGQGTPECGNLGKMRTCFGCNKYYYCPPGTPATDLAQERDCGSTTPYCNVKPGTADDICTTVKDPDLCLGAPSNYVCYRSGYFPDIDNCRTYHKCYVTETENEHVEEMCPEKHYFDTKTRLCVSHVTTCYTFECTGKDGVFVYEPNPQYYFNCYNNSMELMMRCDNGETYDAMEGCVFKCTKAGNVAHEDPQKYYFCAAATAVGEMQKCPGKSRFDPVKGHCDIQFRENVHSADGMKDFN